LGQFRICPQLFLVAAKPAAARLKDRFAQRA
jgi:hypothetical protein